MKFVSVIRLSSLSLMYLLAIKYELLTVLLNAGPNHVLTSILKNIRDEIRIIVLGIIEKILKNKKNL